MEAKAAAAIAKNVESAPQTLRLVRGVGVAIDRLLARHPQAPADLLEALSHSSDRATRKAVTLHANTPKEALIRLAPQFPREFFRNPTFDWLLIEHPNLMFDIGGGVLKNLLKRTECPQSFLAWAASHGSQQERLAVTMNPQASAEALRTIERKGGKAAQAALQHANHPLASGEGGLETKFREAVERAIAVGFTAQNVPTPAQWPALSLADRLGYDPGPWFMFDVVGDELELRLLCLTHRLAPAELAQPVLRALAGQANAPVRCAIANNPTAPPDILRALALNIDSLDTDVDRDLEAAPALAAPCDGDDWGLARLSAVLARDEWSNPVYRLLGALAGNPATPVDILAEIDKRMSNLVRRGVAANPATPAEILTTLAGDSDGDLRKRVAENPATPAGVLATLADDSNREVRNSVAARPTTPIDILLKLSGDSDEGVRQRVARNPAASADFNLLAALAGDPHWFVRRSVAENPSTPTDVLTTLAGDEHRGVREAARSSLWTRDGSFTVESLSKAAKYLRWEAARSHATSAGLLALLADDPDIHVRLQVFLNPATPAATLSQMISSECEDSHRIAFDPLCSRSWADKQAKLKRKDADLKRACETGDVLYLPDELAEKACRKKAVAWRLLGLSHRHAAPEDLARRSRSTEWVERMAVARNPNSPPNVIDVLREDPHRLVARQADATAMLKTTTMARLGRLLREMPDESPEETLVHEMTRRLRRWCPPDLSIYGSRWSGCLAPGQWLCVLSADAQMKLEFLLPEALKKAMVRFWSSSAVAADYLPSVHLPSVVASLAKQSRKPALQYWFPRRTAQADVLTRLATSEIDHVRAAVAANRATPTDVLTTLAEDSDLDVRCKVAANPATPGAILTMLAGDSDAGVREGVAANSAAPADLLAALADDSNRDARRKVAANPATPGAILTMLAGDSDAGVREGVAANSAAPADLLAALADDSNRDVRRMVAANPATPGAILMMLADDSDEGTRLTLAKNPAIPADFRLALLVRLAGDSDSVVRRRIARNPDFMTALTLLAHESDGAMRYRVTANSVTSARTLSALLRDADWHVSNAARAAGLLCALTTASPSPADSAVIQSWVHELECGLIEALPLHGVTDGEFCLAFDALGLMPAEGDRRGIVKAARSRDWLERAAATYAPGIQRGLLMMLLEDPVEAVRQCAVARLRAAWLPQSD